MKTKLILGSLLAFVTIGNSQIYTPSGTIQGSSGSNNVGIGTSSPTSPLEIQTALTGGKGIRIKHNGYLVGSTLVGEASLRLDAASVTPGGREYGIHSIGNGWGIPSLVGSLMFRDETSVAPRMMIMGGSSSNLGYVGINNINPSAQLEVNNHVTGSGGYYGTKSIIDYTGSSNDILIGMLGKSSSVVNLFASCIGVNGLASGGQHNYGGTFGATGDTTVFGHSMYGIYSSVNAAGANDWAGYFVGRVYTSSNTYFTASDQKLKKNVMPLVNGLEKIRQLKPSLYEYRTDEFKTLVLSQGQQMGLIAQEVEKVFPGLVTNIIENNKYNDKGEITETLPAHKAVNYMGLIPVLISAVQDQDKLISNQQQQLDEQRKLIDALTQRSSNATGINGTNSVETGFQMSQNEPNPFTHETVVKYTLPQIVSSAFMAVYDLTGKQITTFPINEKGSSSLTITSEKLAAGIYIYSIVADGKVMDSKRMIVSEK